MINKVKHFIWIIFVIAHFCANSCYAQHIDFLRLINSPRAIGMGECSVNNIDQLAAIYNPGALGLFHMDKLVGVSLPNNTHVLRIQQYDIYLKSSSYSARLFGINIKKNSARKFRAAISFSYSRNKLNYNEFYNIYDPYYPILHYYRSNHFTVALGVEYYLRLGIGLTNKREIYKSNKYIDEPVHWDYGFIVEMPLDKFIYHNLLPTSSQNAKILFKLKASFAFSKSGMSSNPDFDKGGYSIYGEVEINKRPLLSATISGEKEYFPAEWFFSSPRTWGRITKEEINRRGYEFGLADFLYFRWGSYGIINREVSESANGFGIRLSGLLKWLKPSGKNIEGKLFRFLYNNLDIRYDIANYKKHLSYATFGRMGRWINTSSSIESIALNLSF